MEERDFYDAVEYWAGAMTPGSIAGFDGIIQTWKKMDDQQRSNITEYLRSLPYAERYLKTRYWYAIRLKITSDRKSRCETCGEQRSDLQVHHRTYAHRGQEHEYLFDLKAECDRCHSIIHESAKEAATLLKTSS